MTLVERCLSRRNLLKLLGMASGSLVASGWGKSGLLMAQDPGRASALETLSAATWEEEVNKMNKAYSAGIPEDTTRKIISYLQTHYTPENRKQ